MRDCWVPLFPSVDPTEIATTFQLITSSGVRAITDCDSYWRLKARAAVATTTPRIRRWGLLLITRSFDANLLVSRSSIRVTPGEVCSQLRVLSHNSADTVRTADFGCVL